MRVRTAAAVLAGVVLTAIDARADSPPDWSVNAATTNAPGSNVFSVAMGFPGFDVGWQHGVNSAFDVGVETKFNYAAFNSVTSVPEFQWDLTVPLRFAIFHQDMVSVMLKLEPGMFALDQCVSAFGMSDCNGGFGFEMTPGAEVGFQVLPKLRVGVGLDLPMYINFVNVTEFGVAPLIGGNIEFAVLPKMQIGLTGRFGPDFGVTSAGTSTSFGMTLLMTMGFKI